MRKAKSMLGLNIVSQAEGKNLGTVRDLVFDFEAHKLVALVLTDKDLFGLKDATVIPWSQVGEIGPHAVMVPSDDVVLNAHADAIIAEAFDQKKTLDGKKVTTQSGEDLGRVSDLYLDDAGNVTGFEVSGGLFADIGTGKRYMEMPSDITVGEDVILVPQAVATALENQKQNDPGGLTAAYQGAATSASGAYADLADASVDKQREFVIGKTASRDVTIPSDRATMGSNMSSTGAATTVGLASPPALTSSAVTTPVYSSAGSTSTSETVTRVTIEDGAVQTSEGASTGRTVPTDARVVPGSGASISTTPIASVGTVGMTPIGTTPSSGLTADESTALMQRPTMAGATDLSSTGDVVDGEILVRQGEIITAAHADRALATGVMPQLIASASGAGGYGASAQNKLEEAAIGKPAAREVTAPDGTILVAPGMIVTRAILDRADTYGKKNEVIASAGLGAASATAQDTYATASAAAGNLWDAIKEKTAELTGQAHEKKADYDNKAEQNKINNALGRPVTRVILSKDDTMILNTGDLITNAAINQARDAGVLEILLDSVYTANPEITPEMLRAQGKGEAALAEQVEPTGSAITATILPDQQAQTQPAQGDPSSATPQR